LLFFFSVDPVVDDKPELIESESDEEIEEEEVVAAPERTVGTISERLMAVRAAFKHTSEHPRDAAGVEMLGLYVEDLFSYLQFVLNKKQISALRAAMRKAHWVLLNTNAWTLDRLRPNAKFLTKLLAAVVHLVDAEV
jgi:hypothetical protein